MTQIYVVKRERKRSDKDRNTEIDVIEKERERRGRMLRGICDRYKERNVTEIA